MRSVLSMCLLLVLVGCGKYEIVFQVEEVINDGGQGDSAREMLDVDVICLTKADAQDFPELAEGTMWSKEWFSARDLHEQKLRKLEKQVYSFRAGERGPHDTLMGPPLVSGRDTDRDRVVLRVQHKQALSGDSAIIILGRFHDGRGGLMNTRPVVIRPLPSMDKEIIIGVGRTEMTMLDIR